MVDSAQDDIFKKAEEFKAQANDAFKLQNFPKAIEFYTKAIDQGVQSKKAAIYYSNRAFSHLKMDNYGLAIADADEAIKIDPDYVKAYYRKADANIALDHYKEALQSLKKVVFEFKVNDVDAQEKYKFVKKVIKERAFQEAIMTPDSVPETIDFNTIEVPSSYTGPKIEDDKPITLEWVVSLMEHMKLQKVLHKKYAVMLLQQAKTVLTALPSLVNVDYSENEYINVCGDTHGQYYDLMNIFQLNGNPSEQNPYLFNGDFVDRGSFSVEVILLLLAWKVANPKCMHLTRGNHEAKNMNKLYGFEGEVLHKYDVKVYELFSEVFCALPLTYILNNKVMVCHGGLFKQDGVKLADIKKINRFREPPDDGLMCDLLWADPCKENGRQPSKRGISIGFGPDIAKKFLDENKLELLVRSHEMKDQGYEIEADGRVMTIFSAPNYCDSMKNKGAYIKFYGHDMKPQVTTFECVPHPPIGVMKYARNFGF